MTAPEAHNVAVDPIHIKDPVVEGAEGMEFTVMLVPLTVPIMAGLLLTTRIL